MTPEDIQNRVLHRDGLILVVDKPAGLPVHAGPGGGDNLEAHFKHLQYGLRHVPALGHRLDRDTSGCLVLGRHPKALKKLGKLFREGLVEKTYWAIARGVPKQPEGRIALALRKVSSKGKGWRMLVDPAGQESVTDYKLLAEGGGLSLVECYPRTGRTHQIRVHLAAIGCPIVGDAHYGERRPGEQLQLHSRSLTLPMQQSKPPVHVEAQPPAHMQSLISELNYTKKIKEN
ncbi:RNA pseudouridine synthase [Nisaea acidiphila]|uniref:RNA pseudouridine synthase n=1 Tax=Nisaea acidiphila TaxID=1862145 RepID=A0A9J7ASL5_9PROT|nr:RNA pseudouridine synthase [Nisaea acidiphila]UUX49858.1 RNA pseudouridine synthase [Nisaea acidiphila]